MLPMDTCSGKRWSEGELGSKEGVARAEYVPGVCAPEPEFGERCEDEEEEPPPAGKADWGPNRRVKGHTPLDIVDKRWCDDEKGRKSRQWPRYRVRRVGYPYLIVQWQIV